MQHAWAEIEHDFGYKTDQDVPEKIRRRFSRLAGLIELADDEFMEIKRYEKDYLNEVEEEFKENSKSIQIDSISISALLESESYIKFLEKYYNQHNIDIRYPGGKFKDDRISKIVNYCEQLGIKTIDELETKFKSEFPNYFSRWIEEKNNYFYTWNTTPLLEVLYDLKYETVIF